MAHSVSTNDQSIVEYGANIILEQAKVVMAAAEKEAAHNRWPVAIAIVDTGARLVMLHKMDHTQIGSILVAQQKAETAASFKRPSKIFEDAVAQGGMRLRTLGMSNVTPLEGGIPLLAGGKVIGAIGVSGVQSQQDAQVAEAGASALSQAP
ncbi:MAG: GlcG/HbpS family heme-binding protein [Acidiferrobacter sp.]